jgi:RND superfamily putative drug exporter
MIARIATLPAGRRSKFGALIAVIGILVLAGPLSRQVADVEDNGPTSTLARDADSTRAAELLPRFDASGVLPAAVVYGRDGGLRPADRAAIETDRAALAPYAVRSDVSPIEESADGEAATITFGFQTQTDDTFERFEQVQRLVADGPAEGLHAYLTGPAAGLYDSVTVFEGLDQKVLAASAVVVVLLLLLTYRSPVLWLVPLFSIGFAMAASQAVIYLLGKHAGLPVDGQSSGVLPVLVFGVGTDYALLLIARYREELHHHHDRHDAMALAVRRAGPAILASAATVVLGLSVLMLADMNSTRSLGAVLAIGVAGAAVAMVTALPMALTLLGRWLFWPFVPHVDAEAGSRTAKDTSPRWAQLAALIAKAPRLIWITTSVVLAGISLSLIGLNVGTTDAEKYRDPPGSVTGQQLLADHFPAGNSAPADVIVELKTADEARQLLGATARVAEVSSPVTSSEGEWARYQVVLADAPDTRAARDTVELMRDRLEALPGEALVGGPTAQTLDINTASAYDGLLVIPAVLAVILVVLILLLRALVGPLVLIATVVLSYAAALGGGGLLMATLGYDSVDVSLPLLSFVFLVALGVDYTIFLMSRVREEVVHHGRHKQGISSGLIATGGVITSAGLVLAATFSVLTVMPLVFLIGLGAVVALGVLLDTFVVRSLLVPAIATDLGPRFWAPSRVGHGPRP